MNYNGHTPDSEKEYGRFCIRAKLQKKLKDQGNERKRGDDGPVFFFFRQVVTPAAMRVSDYP